VVTTPEINAQQRSSRVRSPKYDPRRYHRSGTLSKKIISGLLMIAAGIFLVAIIRGVFW
jgi:hypothetical protein